MRTRLLAFVMCLLMAVGICAARAANPNVPVEHWVYAAMRELQAAGLLSDYPAAWIAADHPLTRCELAFYIRLAILALGRRVEEHSSSIAPALTAAAETAFARLVGEFDNELLALGIKVEQVKQPSDQGETATYIFVDLDDLLSFIAAGSHAPQEQPAPEIGLNPDGASYAPVNPEPLHILLPDFGSRPASLISLAGEVLGAEQSLGLASTANPDVSPLRIGGFILTDETGDLQGGIGIRVGDQLSLGADAIWFFDLDQAHQAMARLLVDVHTKVELSQRLELSGNLILDYRPGASPAGEFGAQVSAWLRFLVGDDLYFVAEYTLGVLPAGWQRTLFGLGFGEIGLFLLGLEVPSLSDAEGLALTGELVYRF